MKRENSSPVSRSTSFRTAVRKQPLYSVDYDEEIHSETNATKTTETSPSKRAQSFRTATRQNPISMNVLANQSPSSLQSSPLVQCKEEESPSSTPDGVKMGSDNSAVDQRYCSMPMLTKPQSPFIGSSSPKDNESHLTRKLSSNSFNLGSPSKKVIDLKQYFSRSKENEENCQSLKQEGKKVTAFHDSFMKKAAENSPERSPKLYPQAISLTKPLSVSSMLQSSVKSTPPPSSEKENEDPWIMNPKASIKEIPCSSSTPVEQFRLKRSPRLDKKTHKRSRSVDFEADGETRNIDWIVYANRNSLPLEGIPKGGVSPQINSLDTDSEHITCHARSKSFDDSLSVPSSMFHENETKTAFTSPTREISSQSFNQLQLNTQGSEKFQRSYSSTIPSSSSSLQPAGSSQQSAYPFSYIYGAYTTTGPGNVSPFNDYWQSRHTPNHHDLSHNVSQDMPLEEDVSFLSSLPVIVRKVEQPSHSKLSRSYSTPCAQSVKVQGARPQSFNVNLDDHEKLVAEMEDYMKRSDSNVTLCSQQKFPVPNMEDSHNDSSIRFSYASTISGSSYESSESLTDNQSSESTVDSWKPMSSVQKDKNRRSGSYDNAGTEAHHNQNNETKSSKWSLNTWFNGPKRESLPDLQSVLHAGELGSESIGFRMANQEPLYAEFPNLSKVSETPSLNKVAVSVRAESVQDEPVNLKQCDSAYSIQSEEEETGKSKGSTISRADSFYEKRLSMAFNDTEVFRDSAVFCDIDSTELSPEIKYQRESPLRSPDDLTFDREGRKRLPVRQFVKELEEQQISKSAEKVKVRHREPGPSIRQRMESLEKQTRRSQSCSRPNSMERDLRRSSTPGRSVSSSPARDFRRSSTPARSMTASPIMESESNEKTTGSWLAQSQNSKTTETKIEGSKTSTETSKTKTSSTRPPFRNRSISQDRGGNKKNSLVMLSAQENTSLTTRRSFRSRFLSEDNKSSLRFSLPRSSVNTSLEDISSESPFLRERSAPPFSDNWPSYKTGGMKHSLSLGRLDRMSTDIDNLVIMKGWVRQLIEKFQPKLEDV